MRVTFDSDGFDEMVANRSHVHLEMMSESEACLIVSEEGGGYWHVFVSAKGSKLVVHEYEAGGKIERSEQ